MNIIMITEPDLRVIINDKIIEVIINKLKNANKLANVIKIYTDAEVEKYIKKHKKMIQECIDDSIANMIDYYTDGNKVKFFEKLDEKFMEECMKEYLEEYIDFYLFEYFVN
jgi:hypothetical protein